LLSKHVLKNDTWQLLELSLFHEEQKARHVDKVLLNKRLLDDVIFPAGAFVLSRWSRL